MIYHHIKIGRPYHMKTGSKRILSSEDILESHIFDYKPCDHDLEDSNTFIFEWHFGPWWCTTIPSLVTKDLARQKISFGQSGSPEDILTTVWNKKQTNMAGESFCNLCLLLAWDSLKQAPYITCRLYTNFPSTLSLSVIWQLFSFQPAWFAMGTSFGSRWRSQYVSEAVPCSCRRGLG